MPPPSSPSGGAGSPGGLGLESLSPEFFTSVVQGVLSSLLGSLGARAGSSESIAAFIQRLSGSSNIFEPGADGALGEQKGVLWLAPGRGSQRKVDGLGLGVLPRWDEVDTWLWVGKPGGKGDC